MLTWANSSKQKIENYFTKNDTKVSFFKYIISIFCLDELAQINIIYLWPTPRVPIGEKIMDKALKSIKYSLF